jgi:hypothetical protein
VRESVHLSVLLSAHRTQKVKEALEEFKRTRLVSK